MTSGGVKEEINSSKLYAVASEDANATYTYHKITFKAGHTYRFEKTSNYSYTGGYTLRLAATKSTANNQLVQLSRDVNYVDVIADGNYNYLLFYVSQQTTGGTLEVTVIDKSEYLFNEIQKDTTFATGENVPSVGIDTNLTKDSTNLITNGAVYTEIRTVNDKIDGIVRTRQYDITQGTTLNTTSPENRLSMSIAANTEFEVEVDYPNASASVAVDIAFYNGSNYTWVTSSTGLKKICKLNNACDNIGIYISAANAVATGKVTVKACMSESIVTRINQLKTEVNTKADKTVIGNNLFNKDSLNNIIGKYINGQGVFVDYAGYMVSHPIPVGAGESVYISALQSGTAAALYYDIEHIYLLNKITSAGSITNNSLQIAYLYVTYDEITKPTLMVNKGTSAMTYEPYAEGNVMYDTDESLVQMQNEISGLEQNMAELYNGITSTSVVYEVTQGVALNTTSPNLIHHVDIPANKKFKATINYPESTSSAVLRIYFYDGTTNIESANIYNKTETDFEKDYKITAIGFLISANNAIADGTAQLTVYVESVVGMMSEDVDELVAKNNRLRLSDVLSHWMNGEKFPIGFQGDSTTDGVATTGWKDKGDGGNSHPWQDAEQYIEDNPEYSGTTMDAFNAGLGRGTRDYICELAYPKQLQNLLRAELGSSTLRIYNIGYYGANLPNNRPRLDAIYGSVYSDVKMVGIVLGINDRNAPTVDSFAKFYKHMCDNLVDYVEYFLAKGIVPFMVTNQVVNQNGNNPNVSPGVYSEMFQDNVQTLCNKAKIKVAEMYNLEVIDMNNFGRLLMKSSSYAYNNLTENLHFKDLGHKLEAEFLFSELVPWVNKTGDASKIYFGFNCSNCKTGFTCSKYNSFTNDKFKIQINRIKDDSTDTLIFDAYMLVNSQNGAYNVTYHTPVASGYIVVDGDTANPIAITETEMNLGTWDIGLHHVQVYTGESTTIAFKGFLLEQQN